MFTSRDMGYLVPPIHASFADLLLLFSSLGVQDKSDSLNFSMRTTTKK